MPALATLLPLLLAASSTAAAAVSAGLHRPGARVELGEVRVSQGIACRAARWETLRPVEATGSIPLRFEGTEAAGQACTGWAWARVTVLGPTAVTTRAVRSGEPLAGAVGLEEREVIPGREPLASVPADAKATRAIREGQVIESQAFRAGPLPGETVVVVLRAGDLTVEQQGRALPCPRGRACAVLPSGRRVEGIAVDGRILVEVP